MTEPELRRRRPPISCTLCRKRKIKCDKGTPCNNCLKSRNGVCVYAKHSPQTLRQRAELVQDSNQHDSSSIVAHNSMTTIASSDSATTASNPTSVVASNSNTVVTSPRSVSTSATQSSSVEWMKSRIKQLEEQLSKVESTTPATIPAPNINIEVTSSLAGTFHVQHESHFLGHCQIISGSMMHKSRLYGQSHWCNGLTLFLEILEMLEPHVTRETCKVSSGLQKCKYLARMIKSKRTPSWPIITTSDLPTRNIADKIIDCYLRTTETVYRILHIPTFQKDYEALWQPDHKPTPAFLIQLKLVLAIGAITYDDKFSLRPFALKWVYEAHTWYSDPEFKADLSIQTLQTSVLLLLARELVGVGDKLIWITAGSLLRMAMYMGLHRDPSYLPKRSIFATEMRRRLWNTILEMTLQSSISSGGPPLIPLEDFNTEPPGNFNDDQLMDETPIPRPAEEFTQMTTAIALHETYPIRLAIAKFLNDINSLSTYENALGLDAELRTAYKILCRTLQAHKLGPRSPSSFELNMVEFIIQRYLSSLHILFCGIALQDATYAYSRKVVLECSLKIWRLAYPSPSIITHDQDFPLLVVCGSGFFRTVSLQASVLILIELKEQLKEEEGLSQVSLRPDLYPVIDEARKWNFRTIEIGETNIKGYLLMCLMAAPIEGFMQGFEKEELPILLAKAAEDVVERCVPILEDMAGRGDTEGNTESFDQLSPNMPLELTDDWDFMMSDSMFNFGSSEEMGWVFDQTRKP